MNDTIAAISTALGVGAISIIRVSGDKSIEIVNKIFDKDLEKVKSHTIVYGHIVDNENIIDEVLVSVMKSPKTFTTDMINSSITSLEEKLIKILKEAENGKIIKNGINTLIIGRPNVGKSSLLNKLLNEEKAIVTDIEGTTRDIVEGNISLDGIELNIIDTAGIRKTDNIVEQIGVNRSLSLIEKADLIILVLNNNEKLTEDDYKLLDSTNDKKRIIFINKNDLPKNINLDIVDNVVYGSTMQIFGINALKDKIKELFNMEEIEKGDFNYLSNARHIATIHECISVVESIKEGLKNGLPIDILEIDIKKIWELLGNLIGESYDEELLDNLFSRFCLGK